MTWGDLVFPLPYAGAGLGGEGDPDAVKELRLPSFELSGGPAVPAMSEELAGTVESARKRDVDPEGLPFVLSETLPIVPAKLVRKILKGEFVDMA